MKNFYREVMIMKNLDFKIMILAMMIFSFWMVSLVGCVKVEPESKPLIRSVNDTFGYALYHEGLIANINYNEEGNYKYFINIQYTFIDGTVIRMNTMRCDHLPKIGERGKLYVKHYSDESDYVEKRCGSSIQNGMFLWIKDGKKEVKKSKEGIMIKLPMVEVARVVEVSKQYEWTDASSVSPDVYKLVIIKLNNKIITTGRFNENNEWQIETDKGRKSFNKYPTFKVVEWKEFDKE